jgi:hypothetical protein
MEIRKKAGVKAPTFFYLQEIERGVLSTGRDVMWPGMSNDLEDHRKNHFPARGSFDGFLFLENTMALPPWFFRDHRPRPIQRQSADKAVRHNSDRNYRLIV